MYVGVVVGISCVLVVLVDLSVSVSVEVPVSVEAMDSCDVCRAIL